MCNILVAPHHRPPLPPPPAHSPAAPPHSNAHFRIARHRARKQASHHGRSRRTSARRGFLERAGTRFLCSAAILARANERRARWILDRAANRFCVTNRGVAVVTRERTYIMSNSHTEGSCLVLLGLVVVVFCFIKQKNFEHPS